MLSLPSTLPSYLKLFVERGLPRRLRSDVQLYSIKALLSYIVGIINVLMEHPSLVAKLQRAATEFKRKLTCLASLRVFWVGPLAICFSPTPVRSVPFPCVSPAVVWAACCQKWRMRNESVLSQPFSAPSACASPSGTVTEASHVGNLTPWVSASLSRSRSAGFLCLQWSLVRSVFWWGVPSDLTCIVSFLPSLCWTLGTQVAP